MPISPKNKTRRPTLNPDDCRKLDVIMEKSGLSFTEHVKRWIDQSYSLQEKWDTKRQN